MNADVERALENSRARWESRARRAERKLEALGVEISKLPHEDRCDFWCSNICICPRGRLIDILEGRP